MEKETGRLEMFSDGVFAIAITLLVLEIKVPHISHISSTNDLWYELGKLWPSYFAFFLSFCFIFIAWVCHHALFNLLSKSSPQFVYANGFFLFNIAFLPFPTALLAEYITTDFAQPAVLFYFLSLLLAGISWNFLYNSAFKLVYDKQFTNAIKSMQKNARYGLLLNVALTILCWWFPKVALSINILLWAFWMKESAKMLKLKKQ